MKTSKHKFGFTLVETMFVILIFSLVTTLMSKVLVDSLDLQQRALNIQELVENANFIFESMAKEIRVSEITSPDSNCPSSPATTLSIIHPVNGTIVYSTVNEVIHRTVNGVDSVLGSFGTKFVSLRFCVTGTPIDDMQQPRVTIVASLEIEAGKTKQHVTFDFQTSLSQRFLSN